MSNTQL